MRGRRAKSATKEANRPGPRKEASFNSQLVMMIGLGDARLERYWSCAMEGWRITCASYDTLTELSPLLDQTALILCNPDRLEPELFIHVTTVCLRRQIPIIAVGREIGFQKKVEILEMGVDDCLETTCSGRELVARIRAILRRRQTAPAKKAVRYAAGWTIDTSYRKALGPDGATVPLTAIEFHLLKTFLTFPDKIFTMAELSAATRTKDFQPSASCISRAICRLRAKLRPSRSQARPIQTIQNRGYRWSNDAMQ
jgi:DNA-binding response OmpR family regulator